MCVELVEDGLNLVRLREIQQFVVDPVWVSVPFYLPLLNHP
jgi:hypothetical protein